MLKSSDIDRFWSKVDKSGDCWLWTGAISNRYGNFGVRAGKTERAHRVAWLLTFGPIPTGGHVLHRCDNTLCVTPRHLFIGDQAANVADMVAKGRQKKSKLLCELDIRMIRNTKGQTDQTIAERFGISRSYANKIRNQRRL